MPRAEQMPGTQSTNLMWTSEPFLAEWEKVEASMKKKKPRENWNKSKCQVRKADEQRKESGKRSHQGASKVDACGPCIGAVQPLWLWEAEEPVA